jgi:hypothetical protein
MRHRADEKDPKQTMLLFLPIKNVFNQFLPHSAHALMLTGTQKF